MMRDKATELATALRSGNYKQGKETLNRNGKMCCLGVACEISKLGRWNVSNEYQVDGITPEFNHAYIMPQPVMDYFGFRHESGKLASPVRVQYKKRMKEIIALSRMNDMGMPFHFIADFIEQHWAQL